jgi:hypothetical protein
MKSFVIASAIFVAMTGASFAGASLEGKETNSTGSAVGQSSSSYTGNGQYIGGHDAPAGADQTTAPRSRPDAVEANFPGSNNAGGNGKDNGHDHQR